MDRREFLKITADLLRFVGIPAALGTAGVLPKIFNFRSEQDNPLEDNNRNLIKGLTEDRFVCETERILSSFRDAPTGTLMMYYQLFWPIFIAPEKEIVNRVAELETVCRAELQTKGKFQRWHRVSVLRAVAAIHALSVVSGEEAAEYFRSLIYTIHQKAHNEELQREILEIIWQNMTAALIKDRASWQGFVAGGPIIDEAAAASRLFLATGDDVLLTVAVAAWQFLLTYERSLVSRHEFAEDLPKVKAAMERIRAEKSKNLSWLAELERIYKIEARNSIDRMLPHTWEVVMGRHNPKTQLGEASEFFTIMRLQMNYANNLGAQGKNSIYQTRERANELGVSAFTFLAKYGFSKEEWKRLRVSSRIALLPQDAFRYFDDEVFGAGGLWAQQSDAFEEANNPELAKFVPFRRIDDITVAERKFPQIWTEPEPIVRDMFGGQHERLWGGIVAFSAAEEVKHRGLVAKYNPDDMGKQVQQDVGETLVRLNGNVTIGRALEFLKEEAAPFRGKTTVSVGFNPADEVGAESSPGSEDHMSVGGYRSLKPEDTNPESTDPKISCGSQGDDRVALEFDTEEGLAYCLKVLLDKRSEVPFSLPGRQSVIIPKSESDWFKRELTANGYVYSEVKVVSAADVSPDRIADLRARAWRGDLISNEFRDVAWKKAKIEELKKKLSL
jgi:hypothetical protein